MYHFILAFPSSDDKEHFDPDQPRGLLYTKIDGPNPGYKLVGVMYMARYDTPEDDLNAVAARIPLSIAQWHLHLNLCVPPQPEQRNWLMGDATFGLNGSIATAEACRAAGGYFKPHLAGWMTHIYPFENRSGEGLGRCHGRRPRDGAQLDVNRDVQTDVSSTSPQIPIENILELGQ